MNLRELEWFDWLIILGSGLIGASVLFFLYGPYVAFIGLISGLAGGVISVMVMHAMPRPQSPEQGTNGLPPHHPNYRAELRNSIPCRNRRNLLRTLVLPIWRVIMRSMPYFGRFDFLFRTWCFNIPPRCAKVSFRRWLCSLDIGWTRAARNRALALKILLS